MVRHLGRILEQMLMLTRNTLAFAALALAAFALHERGSTVPSDPPVRALAATSGASGATTAPASAGRTGDPRRLALSTYVSRRYRVAQDAAQGIVDEAFRTGRHLGVDPLVILAVIGIESGFNPLAQSEAGAKGLMQVMPRQHARLLREHGGERVMLDPPTNILVGTRILKAYLAASDSIEAALQTYAGAAGDASAEYAQRVLAERLRLEERWHQSHTAQRSAASAQAT